MLVFLIFDKKSETVFKNLRENKKLFLFLRRIWQRELEDVNYSLNCSFAHTPTTKQRTSMCFRLRAVCSHFTAPVRTQLPCWVMVLVGMHKFKYPNGSNQPTKQLPGLRNRYKQPSTPDLCKYKDRQFSWGIHTEFQTILSLKFVLKTRVLRSQRQKGKRPDDLTHFWDIKKQNNGQWTVSSNHKSLDFEYRIEVILPRGTGGRCKKTQI